jgi:phosphoglycolate phosphatase
MTESLAKLREPVIVGFDLDLTLIDTRAATACALRMVNRDLGERIDVDAFVAGLGLPIRDELLRWVPEPRVDAAVTAFRAGFTGKGLRYLVPNPGAAQVLNALSRAGGRRVVITSRRPEIASAALRATRLEVDVIIGGLTGKEKAPAMREQRVAAYVGDHPLDMVGAVIARVPGVGVLTGAHSESELREAGATTIVPTLAELQGELAL